MKWITALAIGALLGFALPTMLNGGEGVWLNSWAGGGTIRPHAASPGLLFSIPVWLISAVGLRLAFNWHTR